MALKDTAAIDQTTELRHLRELVTAIDRRLEQAGRPGEASIALDAAHLRRKALIRISLLEG